MQMQELQNNILQSIQDAIDRYLQRIQSERRLQPRSIKAYAYDLQLFVNWIGNSKNIQAITDDDIEFFIRHLETCGNGRSIIARKLSTLRSFFRYLQAKKYIHDNPMSLIRTPKIKRKEPCFLTREETEQLIKTVERYSTSYYRDRDIAIVKLFLSTGIRLRELVGLTIQDVDLENNKILIRRKGGNQQRLAINEDVSKAIVQYLKNRPNVPFDALFVSKRKKSTVEDYGISSGAVYQLVKKYVGIAGIKKDKVGVHTLRHTVATNLVQQNVHISKIQKLLGHKQITSTQIYMHATDEDLIEVTNLAKVW